MACIICFLSDEFQDQLRTTARSTTDRFEQALEQYENSFIEEFRDLSDAPSCDKHRHVAPETLEWCKALHRCVATIADVPQWFESIRAAYIAWVSGKFGQALAGLESSIKQRGLFGNESNGANHIFCIRGRVSKDPLKKEDLYHIPFNKRFLIRNQRFSITGLPLLYLGLSTPDIACELRCRDRDPNEVYFSSFVLRNPSTLTIADLTNQFPHQYSSFKAIHDAGSAITFDNPIVGDLPAECVMEYYKYILASCCSFRILKAVEGKAFQEEYVLPQMLSERAAHLGFDGIAYTSTQVTEDYCGSRESFFTNRYRENLALFTSYSKTADHDKYMLDKFDISSPIRISDITPVSYTKFDDLKREILALSHTKPFRSAEALAEAAGITFDTHFAKVVIHTPKSGTVQYVDHPLGKIHLFLLYQHMLKTRDALQA